MYIALWHCDIEQKLSVHFLPNLMSKYHIIGKPEARAQAVPGWVNPSLGSEGYEDYFQSSERLVEEEVISKIPCGWEEEWKAFNYEKSSKYGYFQISSQKGAEHQKIS